MANRRFDVFEYRQVLVRMRQGGSDRDVERAGLMGRRTAAATRVVFAERGWLDPVVQVPEASELAAAFARAPAGAIASSLCEPYREQILAWAREEIDASTIHQALARRYGFEGSYSSVQRFVKSLGVKAPRTTAPLTFAPGEAAQVDFGTGPELVSFETGEVVRTWFFSMQLCYSRHKYVEFVLDQTVMTWLGCHRRALQWFGGVPERMIIDNAKCAITRACTRDPAVQRAYAEHAEGWGFRIDALPPRQPQMKGRVERSVGFVKSSFLPLREFRDLADLNAQAREWTLQVGNRVHGTTHEQPLTRFADFERHALNPLPDAVPELCQYKRAKVHGDCHVIFEKRRYSAPYRRAHQPVWVKSTETSVHLYSLKHELIASHPRLTRAGERSTILEHLPPNQVAWQMRDQQWCLTRAGEIGICTRTVIERLFDDRVVHNLRGAQGVVSLAGKYSDARLEAACERALHFDNVNYRAIKTILDNGLDQQPAAPAAPPVPGGAYDGSGRFCRDMSQLFD